MAVGAVVYLLQIFFHSAAADHDAFHYHSSVWSKDIGWEQYLRNELFCVEWNIKP